MSGVYARQRIDIWRRLARVAEERGEHELAQVRNFNAEVIDWMAKR